MSAETGVGPAMASGSQTCRGNWADFPMAPPKSRSAAAVSTAVEMAPSSTMLVISGMLAVPAAKVRAKIPNTKGTSPVFVVMKALMAASEFSFSSHQWPMSRYEQRPTSSHPTSSWKRLFATTRLSMDPVNSDSAA